MLFPKMFLKMFSPSYCTHHCQVCSLGDKDDDECYQVGDNSYLFTSLSVCASTSCVIVK